MLSSAQDWPAWVTDPTWVPAGDKTVYTRIKSGFRAVLEGLGGNGTILVPSYVPGGMVWAALVAGFDVRYYPVSADLTLPSEAVHARIRTLDPDVVLFIHYFGFGDEAYPELCEAAKDAGAVVVEDCARGLFSRDANGELLGATGDVALYCLHKTLPTPNGGLIVTRNVPLPTPHGVFSEKRDLVRLTGASVLSTLGVRAQRTPPVIEQSLNGEPSAFSSPNGPLEPGGLSRRALDQSDPLAVQKTRLRHYRTLRRRLEEVDSVEILTPPAPERASPYGIAMLAPDSAVRERLYTELYRQRLPSEVLTWPAVHRHDVVADYDGARTLRHRLLIVPTHQQLSENAVTRLADCIEEYFDEH